MHLRNALVVVIAVLILGAVLLRKPSASPAAQAPPPLVSPVDDAPTINADQLRRKLDGREEFLLLFVGTEGFFRERRIPGARCVGYAELPSLAKELPPAREIVVYCGCCSDAAEGVSGMAVKQLRSLGFTRVSHLLGHFEAWRKGGHPVEGANPATPEERAFANETQKQELDAFASESARRRKELLAALDHEKDPARVQTLRRGIEQGDREDEIRGLRLKRRLAVESGDPAKAADIDRLLRLKGSE